MPNAAYNQAEAALADPRVRAFLWTLRSCEGTTGANAYLVSYGYHYQNSCAVHPNIKYCGGGYCSEAFGAYQFMWPSYAQYRNKLGLTDFCAHSQDLATTSYLIDKGAVQRLQANDFAGAVYAIHQIWPSVYGGVPNQTTTPCNTMAKMQATYNGALGSAAPLPPPAGPVEAPAWLPPNNAADLSSYGIGNDTIAVVLAGIVLWVVVSWVTG